MLEFLDIDLNTWSVILFFFQALFLLSITFMLFAGNSKYLLLFVMIFFILNQVATVAYGLVTQQLGFILMVVFQFFLTLMTFGYLNRGIDMIGDINDNQ